MNLKSLLLAQKPELLKVDKLLNKLARENDLKGEITHLRISTVISLAPSAETQEWARKFVRSYLTQVRGFSMIQEFSPLDVDPIFEYLNSLPPEVKE